jgi:pimeloyl-ACP methyl ester carboxylesterase
MSTTTLALDVRHSTVEVPGARIHVAEQGDGPLVLLVHGFPETWWSWRRQLPVLAAAGFRAAAIDVRGYGESSVPDAVEAYRMLALVSDAVGVVGALGAEEAVIVGHDWGATIAADAALLRPDVFRAVGLLSVPYTPPGGPRPTEAFAAVPGPGEFYVSYFQAPGRAEAEIDPDVRGWLAGFYASLSGDTMARDGSAPSFVAPGGALTDGFVAREPLPAWLAPEDLDTYAAAFARTGMTGALNRYRNVDRDWEDLAAWTGAPIRRPALFLGGELDPSTTWLAGAIAAFPATLPELTVCEILPGCGHWIQQECAEVVDRHLVAWLQDLPPGA